MANNNITKEAFAKALKELLQKVPLDKISVKDISDQCGLSRNSFYYHFKDKYELIGWIFASEVLDKTETSEDPSKFLDESFTSLCSHIYQERNFYLACFRYNGQNSLYESLHHYYYEAWKAKLTQRYQESEIKLHPDDLSLMARINTRAIVGMIEDWIKSGMHDDYMDYYEQNRSLLDKECFMVAGKYFMIS